MSKPTLLSLLLSLIAVAVPLRAQTPAMTLEELRNSSKLKQGESIEVTEENGTKYKARLEGITERSLTITTKGTRRDLTEPQLREVRHKRPEKWWNGMLIGFGVGVAAAFVGVSTECSFNDPECTAITTAVFVPVFGAIGMGAGAAIDYAIKKQETVFARPGRAENHTWRLSPILADRTAGVRIVLEF